MPHTQTHRTVLLLISTCTGAHTHTHTHTHTHKLPWSLYTVTTHLLRKHSPSLSCTHTCPFQTSTVAQKAPQLHPTFLEVDGLRGPYTRDTGPGMRSLRAVCLPVSSLSRKQGLVQLVEVQLTKDSQQMWQPPSLPTPPPQRCSVFVGPLP